MRQAITSLVATVVLLSASPALAQFVQGPALVGTGSSGFSYQGSAVALSADGTTAIVGGEEDNSAVGAAWIFSRTGATWTQMGAKLVGTGAVGQSFQGRAAAISGDGNTAVVGGFADNNYAGAIWIFVRSAGGWIQQGPKLVGAGAIGTDIFQGWAVAISADGNTVIAGGPHDDYSAGTAYGAAWIFTRSGTTWSQQAKLSGTGASFYPEQGYSVSLSADGNTALVGGPYGNAWNGAAYVFTRSGSTWTQQGAPLTPSDATSQSNFGSSVSLSADGNTAAVGGISDQSGRGAVWIFTRSGAAWTQQGSKLIGAGSVGQSEQGYAVALSANGRVLIEGGLSDNYSGSSAVGAVWSFHRSGGVWAAFGGKLVTAGRTQQGQAVGLSADGLTGIVGGQNIVTGSAAWILNRAQSRAPGDVDGDGQADATLFRSNGDWTALTSSSDFTAASSVHWAFPGYQPVRGDFDGDGIQDPALYNPTTGNWRMLLSSFNYALNLDVNWGGPGYTAAPGDYDGDGRTDPAVYNVATGTWSILKSSSGYASALSVNWGGPGYTPVAAQDFDGDKTSDVVVFRPMTGSWSILKSSTGFSTSQTIAWDAFVPYNSDGYMLVPGDYDGDGKADAGFYRKFSDGTAYWYILTSASNFTSVIFQNLGGIGYLPVPGDYDGDGKTDFAVVQRSTGNWSVRLSSAAYATSLTFNGWGSPGDVPLTAAITFSGSDTMHAADQDGDGQADITVYNAATGIWSSLLSNGNFLSGRSTGWGGVGYQPVPGDYDGDGVADLAVYQIQTGVWSVLLSSTGYTTSMSQSAGGPGWSPVPGDYDGDGRTDFVVYNSVTGLWYGMLSGGNYTTTLSIFLGGTGYVSVPGDYDGDGRTDVAVYQTATGGWSVLQSSTNYTTALSMNVGGAGFAPVQADYDLDGKTDVVVYNSTSGQWYGLLSSTHYATTINVSWGGTGYTPVKGDYDGDGRADLAVYQASTGMWYILLSGSNYTTAITKNWGGPGYDPVPKFQ